MGNVFDFVPGLRPGRSAFNLSYSRKGTYQMGNLYPIMVDEVVPGDVWHVANELVVRMSPMVTPILHEVNVFVHYFFVPYRLLWSSWEDFITGGVDGQNASVLPRWNPTNYAEGSLWDYMGFPAGIHPDTNSQPIQFPLNAYNLIYNEYYRDETLRAKYALTDETIKPRAWRKDYFTSALPWQQRGTAPALPISGTAHAVWADASFGISTPPAQSLGFGSTANTPIFYINGATFKDNARGFYERE